VTEAEPGYADGWLNVARALIQEGETDAAKPYTEKALAIDPGLGRSWFFRALIQKADGDYDAALVSLRRVESQYPRDAWSKTKSAGSYSSNAITTQLSRHFKACLSVDPEDVQAHYNLMLAVSRLGNRDAAEREQKLFLRFKADESSQSITANRASPARGEQRTPAHPRSRKRYRHPMKYLSQSRSPCCS